MADIRRENILRLRDQVEQEAGNTAALWELAVWCWKADESLEAAEVLAHLIALQPQNASALALLGDVENALSRLA